MRFAHVWRGNDLQGDPDSSNTYVRVVTLPAPPLPPLPPLAFAVCVVVAADRRR